MRNIILDLIEVAVLATFGFALLAAGLAWRLLVYSNLPF